MTTNTTTTTTFTVQTTAPKKTSNNHNEQDDNEDDHSERDVDDQLTTITTFCSSWPANEKAQDGAWYMADRIVWSLLSLLWMHLAPLKIPRSLSLSLSHIPSSCQTHTSSPSNASPRLKPPLRTYGSKSLQCMTSISRQTCPQAPTSFLECEELDPILPMPVP